jgi:hypothetical protein
MLLSMRTKSVRSSSLAIVFQAQKTKMCFISRVYTVGTDGIVAIHFIFDIWRLFAGILLNIRAKNPAVR